MGVPMQVLQTGHGWAVCANGDTEQRVDTLLLDSVVPGEWLLIHIDSAVRTLDAHEAQQIRNALLAVQLAMKGEAFEYLFADLIDREPQLPAHLRQGGI